MGVEVSQKAGSETSPPCDEVTGERSESALFECHLEPRTRIDDGRGLGARVGEDGSTEPTCEKRERERSGEKGEAFAMSPAGWARPARGGLCTRLEEHQRREGELESPSRPFPGQRV